MIEELRTLVRAQKKWNMKVCVNLTARTFRQTGAYDIASLSTSKTISVNVFPSPKGYRSVL